MISEKLDAEICAILGRAIPLFYVLDRQGDVVLGPGASGNASDSLPANIEATARQFARDHTPHTFLDSLGKYVVQMVPYDGLLGSYTIVMLTAFKLRGDIRRRAASFGLTNREIDVVVMLSAGSTTSDITSTLGIAEATVLHYIKVAMAKTDTHTRLELVLKMAQPSQSPRKNGAVSAFQA